jgi:predicted nucleic acid-binding protein
LGKQRSRDPKDDPVLACALAARADYLISNDRDLLALGKPFGIAIVTPAEFLRTVGETSS